jgi:hypothetical protein
VRIRGTPNEGSCLSYDSSKTLKRDDKVDNKSGKVCDLDISVDNRPEVRCEYVIYVLCDRLVLSISDLLDPPV